MSDECPMRKCGSSKKRPDGANNVPSRIGKLRRDRKASLVILCNVQSRHLQLNIDLMESPGW